MNKITEILGIFKLQFKDIGIQIATYLPNLLLALIIVIVGWIIAKLLRNWIKKLINKIDLDGFLKKMEIESLLKKTGYRLNSGKFLGEVVRWFVFVGFFIGVLDILRLNQIKDFVFVILENIGNIIVALIIFVVAVIVARFVKNIAIASAKAMDVKADEFIGKLAAFIVYLMATVTILSLFAIFRNMVKYIDLIVMGIIFAISLGSALAFGLGGKEKAKELLEKIEK